jgi:flagellar export protein FliJ
MSTFRFKLQRLLELRRHLEQESAARLARARGDASEAQRALDELQAMRLASAEEVGRAAAEPINAGELQRLQLLVDRLDGHIDAASTLSREAESVAEGLAAEFEQALQKRRVLDKLQERNRASWRADEDRRDRAAMDAIASDRHARKGEEQAQ